MFRHAAFWMVCGLMLACAQARAQEPGGAGYAVTAGDCKISWTPEAEGLIRHRSDCALPLGEQAPLMARLLRKSLEAGGIRTLSWGRLYPDGARDATMALRLALAAKRSVEWDAVRGAPRGGDPNGWVRKLANETGLYEELRAVFRQFGLQIRLSTVEKVLVQPASLLPFFAKLREAGVRPADRLPFDCQAWFAVEEARAGIEPEP
ncbi:MAG: hypothetical protein ACE15B_19070 [Bryobacteraceae bacterium]